MNKSKMVDAAEVCSDLGICRKTLARMIQDGRFPSPLRTGLRRYLWLRTTYEEHLNVGAGEQEQAESV